MNTSISSIKNHIFGENGVFIRTLIYTIGHFFIAAACVMYFTGAAFSVAITSSIVEPLVNSVWYFLLDKYWASKYL